MALQRVRRAGIVRWEWEPTTRDLMAVLAILHTLAAAVGPGRAPGPVVVDHAPGVGRCGLCGAWTQDGACRTPHARAVPGGDLARWIETARTRRAPSNAPRPNGRTNRLRKGAGRGVA